MAEGRNKARMNNDSKVRKLECLCGDSDVRCRGTGFCCTRLRDAEPPRVGLNLLAAAARAAGCSVGVIVCEERLHRVHTRVDTTLRAFVGSVDLITTTHSIRGVSVSPHTPFAESSDTETESPPRCLRSSATTSAHDAMTSMHCADCVCAQSLLLTNWPVIDAFNHHS